MQAGIILDATDILNLYVFCSHNSPKFEVSQPLKISLSREKF